MSTAFTIEVQADELDGVIRNLETLPLRKFLKDIMNDARAEVREAYDSQGMSGNEKYKTIVRTTAKNTATLTARGEDVGFLEFGAGFGTVSDEFATQAGYEIYPGSFSIHNQQMFARRGYWTFDGAEYRGIMATHGMQRALDYLRRNYANDMSRKIQEWLWKGVTGGK